MGILERTKHVIRADLNDLLEKAKNPEVVLEAYLDELEALLSEAQSIRNAEGAELGSFEARLRDLGATQKTLEKKARTCLGRGDEELARAALEHKMDLAEEMAELEREVRHRRASLEVLDDNLTVLRARIAEVNRKRRELRFKRQLLEARSQIQETLGKLGIERDEPVLTEAQDQLVALESRLEAEESLQQADTDDRVLRLEVAERRKARRQAIEEQLEAIRGQLKRKPS
jgi:phage shock protein A